MGVDLNPVAQAPSTQTADARDSALGVAAAHFKAFADYTATGGSFQALKDSYSPDVAFHDPLFGDIHHSDDVMQMWQLCRAGATNGRITPAEPKLVSVANGVSTVQVSWHADYEVAGNHVLNDSVTTLRIDASGKIVGQEDNWDLQKWVNQAFPKTAQLPPRLQADVARAVSEGAHLFLQAKDGSRDADNLFEHLAAIARDVVGWQTRL
jgi:hypothetical protein